MVSLLPQLKEELQQLFGSRQDSYKDTLIKETYKPLPKNYYPRIEIQEIENTPIETRSTNDGERTTRLGYQITCYSRDTIEYDYIDSVKFMGTIVRDYIESNYKMNKVGSPVANPYIQDTTVMTYILRYNCVYDKETNLIYKS